MARARQRIEREAEVLTRLDHPNIVPLLEVLEEGDELTLVMPYLTGGTLADRVARHGPAPCRARSCGWPTRSAAPWPPPTGPASSTATSSRATCSSTPTACLTWPTSAWPARADDTAGLTAVGTVVGTPGLHGPRAGTRRGGGPGGRRVRPGGHSALRGHRRGALRQGRARPADGAGRGRARSSPSPASLPPELRHRLQAMLDPRPERRPSAAALVGGPDGTAVRPTIRRRRAALARVGCGRRGGHGGAPGRRRRRGP